MASETDFLKLTLPEHDEFVDSWDLPVNANMELVDDFLQAFRLAYDGGTLAATAFSIQGSLASLQARLAVSINANGTLNLTGAPELVALQKSKVNPAPVPLTPSARFEQTDRELYDARVRAVGKRDDPTIGTLYLTQISTANLGKLDVALALRHAEFSGAAGGGVPSHLRENRGNTVIDGPFSYITYPGGAEVVASGSVTPILVNIDGYLHRVRYDVGLDFSGAAGIPGQKRFFFFERRDYNNPVYVYDRAGFGPPVASDLRAVQGEAPGPGVSMSGVTFTATAGQFVVRLVRPGDVLVITGGANDGQYIVDTVISNTQLTILNGFPAVLGPASITWSVNDVLSPNFGFVDGLATSDPPYQVGRVYVAEGILLAGPILDITTFRPYAKNGVFVSPDIAVVGPIPYGGNAGSLIQTIDHNLGAVPSEMDVYVTNVPGVAPFIKDPTVTFDHGVGVIGRERALLLTADRLQIKVYATDFQTPWRRFFTDEAGIDHVGAGVNGGLRVIARR
jgi:hypothetical protein